MDYRDGLEWRDVVCQFFQLPIVLGCLMLLLPARVNEPADGRPLETAPIIAMAFAMILVLGVLYAATRNSVHGTTMQPMDHDSGMSHDH